MQSNDYGEITMENGIQIGDGEFYHLEIGDEESVFKKRENAVDHLRDNRDNIDLEDPDVSLAVVETGDEWTIEGLPWKNIALQLL